LAKKHNNGYKEKKTNIENKNSSEQRDRKVRKLEIERNYFFGFRSAIHSFQYKSHSRQVSAGQRNKVSEFIYFSFQFERKNSKYFWLKLTVNNKLSNKCIGCRKTILV
jgi:hypothetical protein